MGKSDSKSTKSKTSKSKKPLKGFMLFSKEHREQVKTENPDLTFGGIGKKLGEMWRALEDDEKQKYMKPTKASAKDDDE